MKHIKSILIGVFVFLIGIVGVVALNTGIESIKVKEKSENIDVSSPEVSGKNIDSTIKFYEVGDYVTFEVVLNGDDDRTIVGIEDNNTNKFIETSYTYDGLKFYMTLKYNKELEGDLNLNDINITVHFSDGSHTDINPDTSDGILKYIIVLILSMVGIFILLKKSTKKILKIGALVLILSPIIVFATDNLSDTYTLNAEHISIVDELTITYEANGGTDCPTEKVIPKGDSIGELPQPIKDKYVLEGWYRESTFVNKVDSSYVPKKDITIYAKWLKSVKGATITPSEININASEKETIVVSNVEEPYTFSSNDESVAKVDSNGVVTGVAEGETTITITGTLSGETKTVPVVVTVIEYINRQVEGQITVGDEIAISGEHFYVVNTNGDETSLLSKYNLYVGDIMSYNSSTNEIMIDSTISSEDENYGLQNEIARGVVLGDNKYYGVAAFSGAKYWNDSQYANIYDSSRSTVAPVYDYSPQYDYYKGGLAIDNGYTIAYYVEEYVNRLKTMGAPTDITGRLITDSELVSLGCEGEGVCTNDNYSWVYNGSYWTGSVNPEVSTSYVGYIGSMNIYDYCKYPIDASYGVRPVIVINTSDLIEEDDNIVKFNANGGSVTPTYKLVKDNQAIGELPTPIHSDATYSFAGWYTSLEGGTEVDETYVPTGDSEIFARWDITPPANPITYVNRQVEGQITVGDEIAIGDEHFYVVNSNSTTTAVLSKYNLYVGDIMKNDLSSHTTISSEDENYGLQNELAIGAKAGLTDYYGTVAFSGAKYWSDSQSANIYDSSRSTTAPVYDYSNTGGTAQDNGYTIAYYVEQYVTRLKAMNAPDTITGRLLLGSEAESLGCMSEWMCDETYPWVYGTSYWLGSFDQWVGPTYVGFIATNKQFDYNLHKKDNQYGVRPVIVIQTSDMP